MAAPRPAPAPLDGFHGLADALVWLEAAYHRVRMANGSTYRPGSPAATEIAAGGRWGREAVRSAHVDGVLPLVSACDHLLTLADTLRSDRGTYAVYTLARGVVEPCARSWYLLGAGIDPDERVVRRENERLDSLHEQRLLLDGMDEGTSDTSAAIEEILRGAANHGYFIKPAKNYRPPHVHEPRPRTTILLRQMLDDGDGKPAGDPGASTYRVLSAVTHSALYGLTMLMQPAITSAGPGGAGRDGTTLMQVQQSSRDAAAHLLAVPLIFVKAVEQLYRNYGWDVTGWREPMVEALSRWRNHATQPGLDVPRSAARRP